MRHLLIIFFPLLHFRIKKYLPLFFPIFISTIFIIGCSGKAHLVFSPKEYKYQTGKGKVVAITVLDNRFNKEFCRNKHPACISLDRSPVTHISEAIERGLSSLGFSVNQRSDTIMQIGINNFYISCFMVTHCAALFLSCLTCFYITQFI